MFAEASDGGPSGDVVSRRLEDAPKTYIEGIVERFDTALGRYLYGRRLGIIEPVFANICYATGRDWFTLRGRVKVDIQQKL